MKAFKIVGICIILFVLVQLARMYFSGNSIPNYSYLGLDDKYHTSSELPNTPIIFVYFSPECGFCETTIVELKKFKQLNKNVSYVFITNQKSIKIIADFTKTNKLNDLTNYIFIDPKDTFPMDFGLGFTYTTPTILAYNKDGKFVKEITSYKDIKLFKF